MNKGTVIIGAGQAGAQLAFSLREEGYSEPITLIGDEPHLPYHRPPLSKDYMSGGITLDGLSIRSTDYFQGQRIELVTGRTATAIDREHQKIFLDDGRHVPYDRLVLATGAHNRELPFDGGQPDNVFYLRTRDEAADLSTALEHCRKILVVGAGFIGMEFASVAAAHGAKVTVVELGSRIMQRAVSPEVSTHLEGLHRAIGVRILTESSCEEYIRDDAGAVRAVRIGGEQIAVDAVLVGIGVLANSGLADAAGLDVDNGIIVDGELRTADPAIFAIGDCARHPRADTGELVRVESVQNASDQARFLAKKLCDGAGVYDDVAWFWSHQAGVKLQIAGLAQPTDTAVPLGDTATGRYSICRFRDGVLTAVESLNNGGDHLASRRILASGVPLSEYDVTSEDFSLKQAAKNIPKLSRTAA